MWLNLSKRCGKPCQTSIDVLSANQNKQTNKQISELVMHQLIWLVWWLNFFTVLVCFPSGVKKLKFFSYHKLDNSKYLNLFEQNQNIYKEDQSAVL